LNYLKNNLAQRSATNPIFNTDLKVGRYDIN